MYRRYTLKEYDEVMRLRNNFNLGAKKISSLSSENINIGTISGWIYRNRKPFDEVIINKIPISSNILTKEKAYILGVLCGDGYVSTGYRVGLSACDRDFVEYFQYCLKRVYELESNISVRKRKNPNAKLQYTITLVSKKVVEDLYGYMKSFKTKEWEVPIEIINSDNDIKSSFLKGLFDSEGCVRFRRNGYGIVQFYSSNLYGALQVKELLNKLDMSSKITQKREGYFVLEITYYKDILSFYENINFSISRKQIKLSQLIISYKRKNLRHYDDKFKIKVLNLLKDGFSAYEIGKMLNFPRTNVYDFIKQKNKRNFEIKEEGVKDI
ncbi:hypothetical protein HYX17_03675 [Candidatus Woesearchaeota archaeon]|nr:hypothetical protein [Candidatus Woesearchaeota archaeon]